MRSPAYTLGQDKSLPLSLSGAMNVVGHHLGSLQILIKSTITWLWVYQKQDCAEWAKLNHACLNKRKHQRDPSAGLEEARCHVMRSLPGWHWE